MTGSVLSEGIFQLVRGYQFPAFPYGVKRIVDSPAVDQSLLGVSDKHFGRNGGLELFGEHISGVGHQRKRNGVGFLKSLQVIGAHSLVGKYAHELNLLMIFPVQGFERKRIALADRTAFG